MMLMVEAPAELFVEVVVGPMTSPPGETLGRVAHVPAGAWLAACLEAVQLRDLATADLPTLLAAAASMQAWAASVIDTTVAELASRRDGPETVDQEVAFALREPIGTAQRRIARARRLRDHLPKVKAAFDRGDLSEQHVDKVVRATWVTDDRDLLDTVQDSILRRSAHKTAAELRRHATQVVNRLDPKAAENRAREARAAADVTMHPGDDGVASIVADLPVEDAMIVKAAVDAYALAAKSDGDERPVGVLRADGLMRLCSDYLAGRSALAAAPTSGGRPIEIGVVVGLRTALGHDALPAEVPGSGVVPREVVAQMLGREQARLRLLVVADGGPDDPRNGTLLYKSVAAYRPTAEQVAQVRATYPLSVGAGSNVRSERCDIDHIVPAPVGETSVTNLAPFDRTWHNRKTRGTLRVTRGPDGVITLTTALGQTRQSEPHDYTGRGVSDPPLDGAGSLDQQLVNAPSTGSVGEPAPF